MGTIQQTAWVRSAEVLADGAWLVTAPGESAWINVNVAGRPPLGYELPLDGERHSVIVPRARGVEVVAQCPDWGCPDLACSFEPCVRDAPGRYTCNCPVNDAELTGAPIVWAIADDARRVRVDLRDVRTHIRARWTGSLPCEAWTRWGRARSTDMCGADASIEGGVGTGAFVLEVRGAAGDTTRLAFSADGGTLDLGEIGPGANDPVPERRAKVLATVESRGDTGEAPAAPLEADEVDPAEEDTADSGQEGPG